MESLEPVSQRQYIVHYASLGPYSKRKDVNQERQARIRAKKAKRQTLKRIINNDKQQCLLVPDDIKDETHRVHMTQCYEKFTLILTGESSGEQGNLRLSKRSSDGNSTWLSPEVCRFCKKGRIIQMEESGSSKNWI